MPNTTSNAIAIIEDDNLSPLDNSAAEKAGASLVSEIDSFLRSLGTAENAGLHLMMGAVSQMAKHKNGTPFLMLYAAFKKRDKAEDRILANVLRVYFGDKTVKIAKDASAAFGFKLDLTNYQRGVQPLHHNGWNNLVDLADAGVGFNSKRVKEALSDILDGDKPEKTADERKAAALKALIKAAKQLAEFEGENSVITSVRDAYRNAVN